MPTMQSATERSFYQASKVWRMWRNFLLLERMPTNTLEELSQEDVHKNHCGGAINERGSVMKTMLLHLFYIYTVHNITNPAMTIVLYIAIPYFI